MEKIMFIGAGFLQDFVIRRAKDLGYYTIAIDGNQEALGLKHADKSAVIDIVDEKACLEFARSENIDGVLTVATDFGVLTSNFIAEKLELPGLKYEAAKRIKNKYEVRKKLTMSHVDDSQVAIEVTNNTNIESLNIQFPVIVKPCDGSGSRATQKVEKKEELSSACKMAIESSMAKKALVETFIRGHEYGVESIVIDGTIHVLAIMKKMMTDPPYYAELGHQIPSELSKEMEQKIEKCVIKAIEALEINHGAVNMDLILNDSGEIHIIDIGARMGGNLIGTHIVPYGTGIDYVKALLESSVGRKTSLTPTAKSVVVTRLLAFPGGTVQKIPDVQGIEKEYDVEIYHHMKKGMKIREYHTNLDGCGYIVGKAEEINKAKQKVEDVYNLLFRQCFGG